MSSAQISLYVALTLIAGGVFDQLARRFRIPAPLLYLFGGFVLSESLVANGFDLGLRWYHFNEVVVDILIPMVIVTSVLSLSRDRLLQSTRLLGHACLWLVCFALPITAAIVYFAIDHPTGFPWLAAFVAAATFAATDPIAMNPNASERAGHVVEDLLEAESTAGDVVAVTLFTILIGGYMSMGDEFGAVALSTSIAWALAGGTAVGVAFGFSSSVLLKLIEAGGQSRSDRFKLSAVIAIASTLAAYEFCRTFELGSGAVAALIMGLIFAYQNNEGNESTGELVRTIGWSARVMVFVLAGATVTRFMFAEQWLAMLIAVAAAMTARWLVVRIGFSGFAPRDLGLDGAARARLLFGGGRGCLVLALALSLPLEFDGWYTVQSMAYGLVVFSLLVHPFVLRRL